MVPADCERQGAFFHDSGDQVFDQSKSIHQIDRIDSDVADIGDIGNLLALGPEHMMRAAHEARVISDFARSMACASTVRCSAVPRDADKCDIETFGVCNGWQPHERRVACKSRHLRRIDRLMKLARHDVETLRWWGGRFPGRYDQRRRDCRDLSAEWETARRTMHFKSRPEITVSD